MDRKTREALDRFQSHFDNVRDKLNKCFDPKFSSPQYIHSQMRALAQSGEEIIHEGAPATCRYTKKPFTKVARINLSLGEICKACIDDNFEDALHHRAEILSFVSKKNPQGRLRAV